MIMKRAVMVVLALLALVAGISVRHWQTVPIKAPLPEPMLVDLEGRAHTLSEWRGKVLVLNFWATWCAPCREEMPEFSRLQSELSSRGLQFVGVAIDEPSEVRDFLKAHPVNYPIWIADDNGPKWADSLGNDISALPFSVVFDPDGKIVKAHIGIFHIEDVKKLVLPFLK